MNQSIKAKFKRWLILLLSRLNSRWYKLLLVLLLGVLLFSIPHILLPTPSNAQGCSNLQASSKIREEFVNLRDRYTRTSNLSDFESALGQAHNVLKCYAQITGSSSEVVKVQARLNGLSLILDVAKWMQKTEDILKQEDWVPIISQERKNLNSKKSQWQEYLKNEKNGLSILLNLSNLENTLTDSKLSRDSGIVYARVNYALSLLRLHTAQPLYEVAKFLFSGLGDISWESIDGCLESASKTAAEVKDKKAEAYALGYRGFLYEKRYEERQRSSQSKDLGVNGQSWLSDAQKYTKASLEIADFGAKNVNKAEWDNVGYQWQWQLARIYEAENNVEAAMSAYETVVKTINSIRNRLLSAEADIQFAFRDKVQSVYREYVSLLLKEGNDSPENIKKARDLIESLQLSELENFLSCGLQITESADKLANQDRSSAIVYPIILPDRIEVILSLPGKKERELIHYKTEKTEFILDKKTNEKIKLTSDKAELILKELRYWLEQPYISNRATILSREVYGWIMRGKPEPGQASKPGECQTGECYFKASKIKTLLFISDGALRNIPMAALKDERYLIQDYAIAIAPRLQLLVANRKPPKHPRALLAALTEKPTDTNFGKLEYAEAEIDSIEKIIKDSKSLTVSKSLSGKNFTRANLGEEIKQGFNIVHLATHGQFNFKRDETFILSGDSPNARVKLDELEMLFRESKTPIDLLILSACETATGDDRDTLGIAGMTAG